MYVLKIDKGILDENDLISLLSNEKIVIASLNANL